MNQLCFLRKPLKPLLHGLLLAIITAAALVFGLQATLDALALEYAMDAYAYVGTVALHGRTASKTEPIDEALVSRLRASAPVQDLEIRTTQAAMALDLGTIPDIMMSTSRLNQHYFAEITIIGDHTMSGQTGPFVYGSYSARLDKQWGATTMGSTGLTLTYLHTQEQPHLKPGSRMFIIGDYLTEHSAVRTNYVSLFTPEARTLWGQPDYLLESPLRQSPYVVLPEELSEEETEAYILSWMEETGIAPLYQRYTQLGTAMTVRRVSDMTLLPYVSKGRIYMAQGRPLYERDAGQKVCLISQNLSLRNRLWVGDTITLSLANGCYTVPQTHNGGGWESGLPTDDELLLEYGAAEEYTIVGIYHQLSRDSEDPNFFGHNDILLPADEDMTGTVARPYALSFRVSGPNYEAFVEEFATWPESEGYDLKLVDNGWEGARDSFYAMIDRRTLMMGCAVVAFMAGALSYGFLTWQQHRYEYSLRRLQGAYRKEARTIYRWGFLIPALPAALTAMVGGWSVYILWLKEAMYNAAPLKMPTDGQILGLLVLWTILELAVSRGFVGLMTRLSERRSLVNLIGEEIA